MEPVALPDLVSCKEKRIHLRKCKAGLATFQLFEPPPWALAFLLATALAPLLATTPP